MSAKQIEVRCPCCESMLVVDVLTAKVLKHAPPEKLDATGKIILDENRWDSAKSKVAGRGKRGGDAFDQALGKEQTRADDLDDLFKKAKDKVEKRGKGDLPSA
ncbi:MAG: hypothetical protein P1V35_08260 [Planctomycetota bacterium]|nr:hypothetical protein [Planctomycetota bacterium]